MELKYIYAVVEGFGTLFGVVDAICLMIMSKKSGTASGHLIRVQLVFAGMWASDGLAWYYRGEQGNTARMFVLVSNFVQFAMCFLIILAFLMYILNAIPQTVKEKKWIRQASIVVCGIGAVQFLLLAVNPFTYFLYYIDADNLYHRSAGIGFAVVSVLALIQFCLIFSIVIAGRKEMRKSRYLVLLSYVLIPIVAVALQIFFYGYSLVNMLCIICTLAMFVEEILAQATWMEKQKYLLREQAQKMDNLKAKIALSQLRPHFIQNVLASAAALCRIDPKRASEAIEDFSEYLRENIGKLDQDRLVFFEEELDYVKVYIKLEQMRFEDRIVVEYDIPVTVFRLPPLTLQPLVENAVRHGICVKEKGGLVQISTREEEDAWRIVIWDDGIGFDVDADLEDGKEHIGIRAVRERLELISRGKLEIESEIGKGTVATISIPKNYTHSQTVGGRKR